MSEGLMRYFNEDKLPMIREPENETADENIEFTRPTIQLPYSKVEGFADNGVAPTLTPGNEDSDDDPSSEEPTVEEVGAFDYDSEGSDEYMLIEAESIRNGNLDFDRNNIDVQVCCIGLMLWFLSLLCAMIAFGIYNNVQIIYVQQVGVGMDNNFILIPRNEWDLTNVIIGDKWTAYQAKRVIVTQTETSHTCATLKDCVELLNAGFIHEDFYEYNFLVAPDGHVYEALGWQEPSSLYYDTPTMVVAFLGNYETRAPSEAQLAQFKILLLISEQLHYLDEQYSIHGMKMDTEPKMLYSYMSTLKNWKKETYAPAKDNDDIYPQFDLYWEPYVVM